MILSTFALIGLSFGLATGETDCPQGEQWSECVNPYNSCKDGRRRFSPDNCEEGCECIDGYRRDTDYHCIPEKYCREKPSYPRESKCPANAVFRDCGSPCPPTCDNPEPDECEEEQCVRGCFCKRGYLMSKDMKCVLSHQCEDSKEKPPPQKGDCPENAIFIECGSPCPPTCEDPRPAPCEEKCISACYCKPGFMKSKEEKCVKSHECNTVAPKENGQTKCPENAIFIECGTPCPPTCDDLSPAPCEDKCVTACYCKPGYLMSGDKCVKSHECYSKKKIPECPIYSAYKSCGTACPPTCKNPYPGPCTAQCVPGCFCTPGYVKNEKGECVRPAECRPIHPECPVYSEYKECGTACPPTCARPYPEACTQQCVAGCFCTSGYIKNEKGECVRPDQCRRRIPRCPVYSEYQECGTACPPTCKRPYPEVCTLQCVAGCFCTSGYIKNEKGECVRPDECRRRIPNCPIYSEYQDCGTACPPTCERPYPGVCTEQCVAGCFCTPGYVKNENGDCITPHQCRKPGPPQPHYRCPINEDFYPKCTPSCKNTCENYNNPGIRCPCGPPGCFCRKGFVRRADGICVLPWQCPSKFT